MKVRIIVMVGIIMGVFSLSSAQLIQPAQIQANLSENETDVFVEIVNIGPETVNGYVLLTLDEFSKIQNFSVPPKKSKVVISAKKPKKAQTVIAEIFLDENQRQIVLTRETNPPEKKENLPFSILSQNYTMIIIAAVIGVITIIGVLIVIKIRSQLPPRQW